MSFEEKADMNVAVIAGESSAPETPAEAPPPPALALRLFGTFMLQVRGQPALPLSRSARALVALLAVHGSGGRRLLERDFVAATLWPDSDDAAAHYNLRRTLTEIRGALGPEVARLHAPRGAERTLRLDLTSGDAWCDIVAFDSALAQAERGDEETMRAAVTLYASGGAMLEGERGDWLYPEREARKNQYLAARERLARYSRERGEPGEAIEHLQAVLALEPTRETAVRDLMTTLSESGQAASALAAYRILRNRLRLDAGGVEPDTATTVLYRRMLAESQSRAAVLTRNAPDSAKSSSERQRQPVVTEDESGTESALSAVFPIGAVTFLFTDIEGSTRNWQSHPEEMRLALMRHDRLVEDAIAASNGVVFKTVGDGFCTAFAVPSDAVSAAVEAQRALQHEPWPEAVPMRVRMALHTGAAELRGGDYFGNTVNRTARLLSAGHGGQILVSAASFELLRDFLPSGVVLHNLGKQWLRDIDRPEDIFAISHPDLPDPGSFPPLRTLGNPALPNNLPRQATSFVGREREMSEVRGLLAKTSLLTLVGTGGTGKTRLALQAAAGVVENYPDGVWFVELAAISDPALVPQAIGQALGVKELAGQDMGQTLTDYVQPKRLMILLDNCEHLIDACARTTNELIRTCSQITVMATSREALGVPGEQLYRVPPLSIPDPKAAEPQNVEDLRHYEATRLFLERVSLVRPDYVLTQADISAVAQLCCQLDGIPLALELAAARVRSLSISEVNERLGSRFRLLTGGGRSSHPRQQTLRALIDWSYDLLSDREKRMFERLSVFVGGWTIEAAESVCAGEFTSPGFDPLEEWEVLDLLMGLVDKSLVLTEGSAGGGGSRYRMLETIRQYAVQRRGLGDDDTTLRDRHRDWCLALAEEAKPHLLRSTAAEWFSRLESEHDNFRAALVACAVGAADDRTEVSRLKASIAGLRISAALVRFWLVRCYFKEGREQLQRALREWPERIIQQDADKVYEEPDAQSQEPALSLRARKLAVADALRASGILANAQADSSTARTMLEKGIALYREIEDKNGIASSLGVLGIAAFNRGDYREAQDLHRESLRLYRELGDEGAAASALNNLGTSAIEQGDNDAARELHEESLAIRRKIGDQHMIAMSLNNLGIVSYRQGNFMAAQAQHEESMAINRAIGDKHGVANSLTNLSLIASSQGDYVRAVTMLEESLSIDREIGDKRNAVSTLGNIGAVRFYEGNFPAARAIFQETLEIRRQIGDKSGIASSLNNLAETAAKLGDYLTSRSLFAESLAIKREVGDKFGTAIALIGIGNANLREDDRGSARAHFLESLKLYRETGNRAGVSDALNRLAEVDLKDGETRRAVVLWCAADALRIQLGLSQDPADKVEADAFLLEVKEVLGDAAFSAAWDEGRALAWEHAAAYALVSPETLGAREARPASLDEQ